MKPGMRVPRALAFVAVLLASIALLLVAFLEFGMCVNEVVSTVPSPDRRHHAVIFQRDCGATTDFSTQVTLDPLFLSRPLGVGNVWIADAGRDEAPRAQWGGPEVSIAWTSPTNLRLLHHPRARIFRAEPTVGNIEIAYGYLEEKTQTPNKALERTGYAGRSAPSR